MSRIQILEENLINKIAAGEVVERPSSVVKELVENAIDAGADQIFVTLINGGKDLISVLDNGSGMTSEEVKLSVQRHATSKIHSEEELFRITTMGFRGEALAAISSVSRFEITSCQEESVGGFQLRLEGGKLKSSAKIGFPKGTRVQVENLFFNTPARQKFLKSIETEYQHIHDLILRLSLGNPAIQFRLTHNKKMVLNQGKGESFEERVKNCFGSEIAKDLIWMEHEEPYLKFRGLFSNPQGGTRPSKRWQHIFVNGRYVKCPPISQGIYEGYKTLLMKQQHPMFFVQVDFDPREVDVNVHPAKTEIRLKNPALVSTILAQALQKELKADVRARAFKVQAPEPTPLEPPRYQSLAPNPTPQERVEDSPQLRLPPDPVAEFQKKAGIFQETNQQLGFAATPPKAPSKPPARTPEKPQVPAEPTPLASRPTEEAPFLFSQEKGLERAEVNQQAVRESSMQVIGQLHQKYILAQDEGRLVLVDQHSAHERVRFEEIRNQFYSQGLPTHRLLIPEIIELAPQDGLLLEHHLEAWNRLGFGIEPFGGNDYRILEVPAILKERNLQEVIQAVLDEISQFGRSGKLEVFFNQAFEKMACHSAIRAGQNLTSKEMQALLNQLEGLDLQLFCPHGRPVLVDISLNELDKRFKRIV